MPSVTAIREVSITILIILFKSFSPPSPFIPSACHCASPRRSGQQRISGIDT
jgi:hypothetical protein